MGFFNSKKELFWFALLAVGVILNLASAAKQNMHPEPVQLPDAMTITQWQRFLNDKGYYIAIDGELGNETEAAWNAYCRDLND